MIRNMEAMFLVLILTARLAFMGFHPSLHVDSTAGRRRSSWRAPLPRLWLSWRSPLWFLPRECQAPLFNAARLAPGSPGRHGRPCKSWESPSSSKPMSEMSHREGPTVPFFGWQTAGFHHSHRLEKCSSSWPANAGLSWPGGSLLSLVRQAENI